MFAGVENPLRDARPQVWNQLVDAIGPSSLLLLIDGRLSAALRATLTAEDIFQEALLHAWRDRERQEWLGLRAFRAWIVSIAENRIRDAADRAAARKRGAGVLPQPLHGHGGAGATQSTADGWAGPADSTTPSRVASAREQADLMRQALASLPDETREIVRLRLFEQLEIREVAARLGIGESAVRHRFRTGAELYKAALRGMLSLTAGTRTGTAATSPVALDAQESSP